jgi:hypothetical protein
MPIIHRIGKLLNCLNGIAVDVGTGETSRRLAPILQERRGTLFLCDGPNLNVDQFAIRNGVYIRCLRKFPSDMKRRAVGVERFIDWGLYLQAILSTMT